MQKKEIHDIIEIFETKLRKSGSFDEEAIERIVNMLRIAVMDYAIDELNKRISVVEKVFPELDVLRPGAFPPPWPKSNLKPPIAPAIALYAAYTPPSCSDANQFVCTTASMAEADDKGEE